MWLEKIISGGQTGVDRGALDAALGARFPCGGCARAIGGRRTERSLTPLTGVGYRQQPHRRRADRRDASHRRIRRQCGRPLLQMDGSEHSLSEGLEAILRWLGGGGKVLSFAGPPASGWPQGHESTRQLIGRVLGAVLLSYDR